MVAKKYIDKSIPNLKKSDTISFALDMMEEYRQEQLPIVENHQFLGIVTKDILDTIPNIDSKTLVDVAPLHEQLVIQENFHLYELARLAADLSLSILPVFDSSKNFKGMLSIEEAMQDFLGKFAAQPVGAIIVLQIKAIDFSLAEISRLVESNEAKVISMFTEQDSLDPTLLQVTIKLNTIDLTRIIATFERFEFRILAKFHDYETQQFESNRIDLLLKYLEI